MKILICVLLLSLSTRSYPQSQYTFKGSGIQATLPKKPLVDTTVVSEGTKIRVVISKDSSSNYYLTLMERSSADTSLSSPNKVDSFMDGVIDGMKDKYHAEVYFVKELSIHSTKVREYDLLGFLGEKPLTVKSWVWLKGNTINVCQHMYLTENEKALRARQQLFFSSLVF